MYKNRFAGWFALVVTGMLYFLPGKATTQEATLYINRGEMLTVDSTYLPYLAFNATASFSQENSRLIITAGDTLNVKVINTDTTAHGFAIKGSGLAHLAIAPNDSATLLFTSPQPGCYIFYDPMAANAYRYLGLAGMLTVTTPSSTAKGFYWNIKDHQGDFNIQLAAGGSVNWSNYYPDYFTINGKSNPHINSDTSARVTGNVHDTLLIYMVNTGQALHSIHYHGYHATILFSSRFPDHKGRSKDTFAIHSMESVVVELIPHQPGEYPVHDHNLVAVSGGKRYPNGMFLTLLIK